LSVLLGFLHQIAGQGMVYDLIQSLAGVGEIHRRLATPLQGLDGHAVVVDLAGGTGTLRKLFPENTSTAAGQRNGQARRLPAEVP